MSYSANDIFRKLAQNLKFEYIIFDDPVMMGKGVELREESKNIEIDAALYRENIICLVCIDKGNTTKVESKYKKFFNGLDRIERYSDLKLCIYSGGSKEANIKAKKAIQALSDFKVHIKKYSINYKQILRKIAFCPNRIVPQEILTEFQGKEEFIIDKEVFEYFNIVNNRLNNEYLLYDFLYFLDIRKIDIDKEVQGRVESPPQKRPYTVERLQIKEDEIILYTINPVVSDIADLLTVLRIAGKYDKRGFQRVIKSSRLKKINEEYLEENSTFPNNIIIALNPNIYKDEHEFYDKTKNEFRLYDEYNSLFIIDGQHRFFSFIYGKKLDRQIIVTLIYFENKNLEKRYLQMYKMFYEINKKSERLDPNLAFSLMAKIDNNSEQYFWHKVFTRLLKDNSWFKTRYSFRETTFKEDGKKSILSVLQYGGVIRLNERVKKSGFIVDGLNDYYNRLDLNQEEKYKFAYNLIDNFFDILKEVLHSFSIRKNTLEARDLGAIFRLIRHFIISDYSIIENLGKIQHIKRQDDPCSKKICSNIMKILKAIEFNKIQLSNLATSNWAAVEGIMLRNIHNNYQPNFGNKELLSKKGLEFYNNPEK